MLPRTPQDGRLQSSRLCHRFACHKQGRNLVTNPYQLSWCVQVGAEERNCSRIVVEFTRRTKGLKEGSKSTGLVCAIALYAEFGDGVTQDVEPGGRARFV